jgi:hypothetical protein
MPGAGYLLIISVLQEATLLFGLPAKFPRI